LADLFGEDLPQRPSEGSRVVAEQHHVAATDLRGTGHHSVAVWPALVQAELSRAVASEQVQLLEGLGVDQALDTFAGRELALLVLAAEAVRVSMRGLVAALP